MDKYLQKMLELAGMVGRIGTVIMTPKGEYTSDRIGIRGTTKDGREYTLELACFGECKNDRNKS